MVQLRPKFREIVFQERGESPERGSSSVGEARGRAV